MALPRGLSAAVRRLHSQVRPPTPRPGAATPGAPASNPYRPGTPEWRAVIEADPLYQQGIADINAADIADRSQLQGALRSALVRFGSPDALRKALSSLQGLPEGFGDLLDEATIGAATAADQGGTSLWSQLEKQHALQNQSIQDVLAANGIYSSGQTGYELGNERQRHTIAQDEAVSSLLDYIRGNIGEYTGRVGQRNLQRGGLLDEAGRRIVDLGLEPASMTPARVTMPAAPPVARLPVGLSSAVRSLARPRTARTGIRY